MGTHNTSNKLPTAHEMRLKAKKNQELQESRLADLPLYKECMFRLAESTGRYSRERIICGVPTNEFQDVRIERGTDASAIQQVQDMLEESGYYSTWETGASSGFTNHDALRICWDARVIAVRFGLHFNTFSGRIEDPCNACSNHCAAEDGGCHRRDVFRDLM